MNRGSPNLLVAFLVFSVILNFYLIIKYVPKSEIVPTCETIQDSTEVCPKCSQCTKEIYESEIVIDCVDNLIPWDTVGQPGNKFGCRLKELLDWVYSLKTKDKHVFAQNGEDGVTEAIFERIGHGNRYFVEFGVQNGTTCNTRYLREKHKWKGLLMDNDHFNASLNLRKESVWVDNVIELFRKYKVPKIIDYLSVDTDFSELWLIKTILEAGYKPRVIISEINGNHAPFTSLAVPSAAAKAHGMWKYTRYFGTSALSLTKLLIKHGYQAVYVEKSTTNIFFIHKSELHNTDLALAHWVKVISEKSKIGKRVHRIQSPKDAHSHICAEKPCDSSIDW